jgi:alkanesulfonate monooxygenase SsuD/methylene tetrahydromethanopterin reductase-like flavin-dependent oxidoreductase (luciferase family)
LIEEICMLDQLSGGRLELGVGRGVSPIEVGFYGVDPKAGPRQFPEALQLLKKGLTADELTFNGLVVLAETDAAALRTAQRAYASWLGHMRLLWDQRGVDFPLPLPADVGPMIQAGAAFVGTAAGFRDFIAHSVGGIGANYMTCDVAFGDMTFDEAMRTTQLIGRDVIPAFADD